MSTRKRLWGSGGVLPLLALVGSVFTLALGVGDERRSDSILWLEQALRWSPDFWQARFHLSVLLLAAGESDAALAQFHAATQTPGSQISPADQQEFLTRWRARGM